MQNAFINQQFHKVYSRINIILNFYIKQYLNAIFAYIGIFSKYGIFSLIWTNSVKTNLHTNLMAIVYLLYKIQ